MTPSTVAPARVVLDGVPRVHFYQGGPRPPEDDPFPACLRAYLEYRGEDLGFKARSSQADFWHDVHVYFMGASGAAFRMTWDSQNWNMGATDFMASSANPLDGIRRAFEAAGYGCDILLKRDYAQMRGLAQAEDYTEADFRDRIVHSLRDQGRPVMAFGVVGPPECGLITGYDEGGDVLIGWSFFQDMPEFAAGIEREPSGYYRKRDWFADTSGLILIGDPCERPAPREMHRAMIRAGLELLRAPVAQGFWQGQAAYSVWADTLLNDALFSAEDQAKLNERYQVHHGTAGTLAEARAWGASFLHYLAEEEPEAAAELVAAAVNFDAIHDLVWAIWEFTRETRSGHLSSDPGAQRFATSVTRGRIVPMIRLARKEDAEAAQHLEKALEIMGEPPVMAPAFTPGRFGRAVLPNVPKIGYHIHLCPFPGSLYAALKYVGDPCDYDFLMGVTGAAFRRIWNRDDGGNVDLMYLAPEPYKRADMALGYELRTVPRDRDQMLDAIRDSIARGRPAIDFGVVGPPEAGLITGYDQCGDVLIGWNYFQDMPPSNAGLEYEPDGYYRRPDWFAKMEHGPNALIVVGDKHRWPGPSKRDILVSTLKWAIDLERTTKRAGLPDHVCGLVAYESWARGLEIDADYPKDDPGVMGTRSMVHADQCVMLDDRRSAAKFLRLMVDAAPEAAEPLQAAADLYDKVADEGKHIWLWGMDNEEIMRGLVDPATRRDIARHIRIAGEVEAKAVDWLEKALSLLD